MTITCVTNASTVLVGKWICGEPILRDGICNAPREVLRVSGHRVYFVNRDNEESFRLIKTIKFVCDTKEEGERMHAISEAQIKTLQAAKKEFGLQISAELEFPG
jgi:hypothetical protein